MGVRIAFLGDIAVFEHGLLGKNWKEILQETHNYLSKFDIVVANLEVPITESTRTRVIKGIHLRTDTRIVDILKYLNITHVSLGNNHIYDFGEKGVSDTCAILKKNGIHYFGIDTMPNYLDLERNISFHSFCCYSTNGAGYGKMGGIIPLTEFNMLAALEQDRNNDRFSVVCLHWGDEYSNYPNMKQVNLFHKISQTYKVLIFGSHTHVIQGIEKIGDSMCVYSAGNFLMDKCVSAIDKRITIAQNQSSRESFIFELEIDEELIKRYTTTGTYYDESLFKFVDNQNDISKLSKAIKDCHTQEYVVMSNEAAKRQKAHVIGKKDIRWLLQKLNYNSVLAKIFSYVNRAKYNGAY